MKDRILKLYKFEVQVMDDETFSPEEMEATIWEAMMKFVEVRAAKVTLIESCDCLVKEIVDENGETIYEAPEA